MSALGDYYAAQTAEKLASIPLVNQQVQGLKLNNNEITADAASRRNLQGAQAFGAAASGTAAIAQGKLLNTQASVLPGDSQARRSLEGAQAGLFGAQSSLTPSEIAKNNAGTFSTIQSGLTTGPLAASSIADTDARTALTRSNTYGAIGFAKGGIAGVDKAKPAAADTISAKLAPGEAVLNKGAVHHYGSDVIDHMNKMGLMNMAAHSEHAKAMGYPDPHAPPKSAKRDARKAKK